MGPDTPILCRYPPHPVVANAYVLWTKVRDHKVLASSLLLLADSHAAHAKAATVQIRYETCDRCLWVAITGCGARKKVRVKLSHGGEPFPSEIFNRDVERELGGRWTIGFHGEVDAVRLIPGGASRHDGLGGSSRGEEALIRPSVGAHAIGRGDEDRVDERPRRRLKVLESLDTSAMLGLYIACEAFLPARGCGCGCAGCPEGCLSGRPEPVSSTSVADPVVHSPLPPNGLISFNRGRLRSDTSLHSNESGATAPATAYRTAMTSAGADAVAAGAGTAAREEGGAVEGKRGAEARGKHHPTAYGVGDMEDSIMRGPSSRQPTEAKDSADEVAKKFRCEGIHSWATSCRVVLVQAGRDGGGVMPRWIHFDDESLVCVEPVHVEKAVVQGSMKQKMYGETYMDPFPPPSIMYWEVRS